MTGGYLRMIAKDPSPLQRRMCFEMEAAAMEQVLREKYPACKIRVYVREGFYDSGVMILDTRIQRGDMQWAVPVAISYHRQVDGNGDLARDLLPRITYSRHSPAWA